MARRYRNPALPLLGVEFFDALEIGAGAAGVAVANDKMVTPFLKGMLPSVYGSETPAKLMDFVTTLGTGFLVSKAVSFVSRSIAQKVAMGAAILAVPKLVSIVVPGFFLNAGLPTSFTFANPLARKEIAAATNGGPNPPQSLPLIGVGSTMGI